LPYFDFIRKTEDYQNRVGFNFWFTQKILNIGGNKKAYWPVHWTSQVYDAENILLGVDTCPGIMKGCYIQGKGGIEIGDYTQIAPNVIIVSANHDIHDSRKHLMAKVKIGKYCWLGAGSKIMPGVELGDFTIVGAGAVVTSSFSEGYCVVGGVPARLIKKINPADCVLFENKHKFHGYLSEKKFHSFKNRYQAQ
jgi:acetyltransferase-like isoleucine patch superfamily enzyme